MKLLFIYGPPAAGKLTVAQELAKLTGFKILHNHLTFDLVSAVFEFGTKPFTALASKLRLDMIETAAQENIDGLIFTYCYAYQSDDWFIREVQERINKHGGTICFVHLYCEKAELTKRVQESSRKKFQKVNSVKKLSTTLEKYDFFSPIPFVENLVIDNTDLSPRKTAERVRSHFEL